jgi:predicted protein tyrosine phosphatase
MNMETMIMSEERKPTVWCGAREVIRKASETRPDLSPTLNEKVAARLKSAEILCGFPDNYMFVHEAMMSLIEEQLATYQLLPG